MSSNKKIALVLDASAIINMRAIPLLSTESLNVIPSSIVDEIKDFSSKMRLETIFASNILKKYSVDEKYLNITKSKLKNIKSNIRLSEQDIDVLSLAYQLKTEFGINNVIILTDDYEIQNSGSQLGFSFKPITQPGIKKLVKWEIWCSNCNQQIKNDTNICEICTGTDFFYRVKRYKRIKKSNE